MNVGDKVRHRVSGQTGTVLRVGLPPPQEDSVFVRYDTYHESIPRSIYDAQNANGFTVPRSVLEKI